MPVKNKKTNQPNLYAGLSGLQLPMPKYLFPEEHKDSSRLHFYSTFFNSIEINSTFYKLPLQRTIINWSNSVPANFKFTFKLWKEITHVKNLDFKDENVERYFQILSVSEKKGCILVQFPPSLGSAHILQLHALLHKIKNCNITNFRIAVEFRNKSWYNSSVYDLLNDFGVALVIQDIPKSPTPMIDHKTNFIYLRFHGPSGNYRDSYSDSFLYEYAGYVKEWLNEGKDIYLYFNNTMGDAFKNLQTLHEAINSN